MTELDAHALAVDVPQGWEGRIFRRAEAGDFLTSEMSTAAAPVGEKTLPVVHVASIPMPGDVADYGGGIVERLGPLDALVVLKEFDPAEASTALFAHEGLPRALDPEDFQPNALQRQLPNQAGHQVFFHEAERAFCLYVVLGGYSRRYDVVPGVNAVLASMRIEPPAAAVFEP